MSYISLTHFGREKMADSFQTIFSSVFSWMKNFVLWFKFHWDLFPMVQLIISLIGSSNGLTLNRQQAIIWTNDGPVYNALSVTRPPWVNWLLKNESKSSRRVVAMCLRVSEYHQTFDISGILVGNKIVDHWDVVGASPVDAAPTTSSFPT